MQTVAIQSQAKVEFDNQEGKLSPAEIKRIKEGKELAGLDQHYS